MIFKTPHILTKIEVWFPKYSTKYTDLKERVALLACYKVDGGSPWIIVEFTKAQHLKGQRYCIKRSDAQACPVVMNGNKKTAIPCYEVPMSKLENWDTVDEVKQVIAGFGW